MSGQWVDLPTAASLLDSTTEAVRKRATRGTLRSERRDGRVVVWVDDARTEGGREAQGEGDAALVESLQDQVTYLRSQLDAERKANDENRRLLAGLIERMPALEAGTEPSPSQASEAGAQEPAEAAPMPAPAQADTGAQDASRRVPWWRRMFGR